MSAVGIVTTLLAAHAPLAALVPAAQMRKGALPKGVAAKSLLVQSIGRVPWQALANGARFARGRVRVVARSPDYDELELILDAARAACGDRHGAIAGFVRVSVLVDVEGPDFVDPAALIFERAQDFKVAFSRPA